MKVRFRFARGPGWMSRLIEWFGGGIFSHVDVGLPDGRWLGSRSDKIPKGTPAGVQIRPSNYLDGQPCYIMILEIETEKARTMFDWLNSQIGKGYDKIGILGIILGRSWRDDDAWFCSELATAALEVAEVIPRLAFTPAKITPNSLALVLSALGAK